MSTEYLRNNQGHQLARIDTDSNGNQRIYNNQGHYLGEYRASSNTTHNPMGHQVGYGNLITTFLSNIN